MKIRYFKYRPRRLPRRIAIGKVVQLRIGLTSAPAPLPCQLLFIMPESTHVALPLPPEPIHVTIPIDLNTVDLDNWFGAA